MSLTQNLLPDTPTERSSDQPFPSGHPAPGGRRLLEVPAGIGVVAVWLALGFLLGLGFVGLILLGVLLLAAFQILVRRRSVPTLLARDSVTFANSRSESGCETSSWDGK